MLNNTINNFKELDTLPINILVFELNGMTLNFSYVNDSFLNTYKVKNHIYSENLYTIIFNFTKDNILKLRNINTITNEFVYKNNNVYGVSQNTYQLRTINNKDYVYVYSFFNNANFLKEANVSNIILGFSQPAFLLNTIGEVVSVNDAIFEMLKIPKTDNLSIVSSYFRKINYFKNESVSNFINDNTLKQKVFENTAIKNAENEDVVVNFTTIKVESELNKTLYLVIFDETVKNIINSYAVKQLERMAYYDHLCDVYNRRYFLNTVNSKIHTKDSHSIFILDIDHFKSVNDTYGHAVGDDVIKTVSGISDSFITSMGGLFARYGGEEFIGYIQGKTQEEAMEIGEMIRQEIEATSTYSDGSEIKITVSIGVAFSKTKVASLDDMIKFADSALYLAKNTGRNNCKLSIV